MPTLWFGGSFNPIHNGHLICSRAIAEVGGFDKVILVPSGQSPHKPADASMASAEHRLEMCRLAIANEPFFEVDDLETRRSGPSYTIETVQQLKQSGHPKIAWLIGADMALSLPRWHQSAKLLAEVDFILMARPGWRLDWWLLPREFWHLEKNVLPAPLLEISSTQIRQRLIARQSIRYLTPDSVMNYIRTQQLYSESAASGD